MNLSSRVPLAWRNLVHDRRRLVTALCGIGFAVVLMFMETGFQNALFDSTVQIIRELDADIVLINKAQYALVAAHTFDRRRLYQARGCPGVATVYPLYIETFQSTWKLPPHKPYPIRVIAWNQHDPVFRDPALRGLGPSLSPPCTALIDTSTKMRPYGLDKWQGPWRDVEGIELAGQPLRLAGTFHLGTDFANDGNLAMSEANFARYFGYRAPGGDPLDQVDVGVVRVADGADVQQIKARLKRMFAADVLVATRDEMVGREIGFWARSTPIGFIFTLGTVLGFVVGVIICYQIIHSDIADHMPEYATLKAMGYGDGYFVGLVLKESFYLSVLSFLPGVLISLALYQILAGWTGLLMILSFPRAVLVFLLTLAMCVVSGGMAMRKVLSADPAELF